MISAFLVSNYHTFKNDFPNKIFKHIYALKDVQKNVNHEIHHPLAPHVAFWVI